MGSEDDTDHLLVDCTDCSAFGTKMWACSCSGGDGTSVAQGSALPPVQDPWSECRKCQGSGTRSQTCITCGGSCKVRAQLVLTAINLDTAAIASATVIPGALTPQPITTGDDAGRMGLHLKPVIEDLAAQAGGEWVLPPTDTVQKLLSQPIALPAGWSSDLDPQQRWEMEAAALALRGTTRRRIFTARNRKPEPPSPDQVLARLCRLADALCVDLMVYRAGRIDHRSGDVTRWGWYVAFTWPGAPLPSGSNVRYRAQTLAEALVYRTPAELLHHMNIGFDNPAQRQIQAHTIRPLPTAAESDPGGAAELESRLTEACGPQTGAVAIWRDGDWAVSTVSRAGFREDLIFADTGQIRQRMVPLWAVDTPPPDPGYWGEPIHDQVCASCETGTPWKTCECVELEPGTPYPECELCGGSGMRQEAGGCGQCGGTGRVRSGVTFTLTDLDQFHRHLSWEADANCTFDDLGEFYGHIIYKLPSPYRLAEWFQREGVDISDVVTATGMPVGISLLDGSVWVKDNGDDHGNALDLTRKHIASATFAQPAAHVMLVVTTRQDESLEHLVNMAFGMGYDVAIAVERRQFNVPRQHSLNTHRWAIKVVDPTQPPPHRANFLLAPRSLQEAVARARNDLLHSLSVAKIPPETPLPAPQQSQPPTLGLNGTELGMMSIANDYQRPTGTVIMRLSRDQASVEVQFARPIDPTLYLTTAATVPQALTNLGHTPPSPS